LVVTAQLNDVDPQTWLADMLVRNAGHSVDQLDELLPWKRTPATNTKKPSITGGFSFLCSRTYATEW
jgi:hypothetical protein